VEDPVREKVIVPEPELLGPVVIEPEFELLDDCDTVTDADKDPLRDPVFE